MLRVRGGIINLKGHLHYTLATTGLQGKTGSSPHRRHQRKYLQIRLIYIISLYFCTVFLRLILYIIMCLNFHEICFKNFFFLPHNFLLEYSIFSCDALLISHFQIFSVVYFSYMPVQHDVNQCCFTTFPYKVLEALIQVYHLLFVNSLLFVTDLSIRLRIYLSI